MAGRKRGTTEDKYVRQIHDVLTRQYLPSHPRAKIHPKRYNSVSVRVRIIDPDFAGKSMVQRDDAAWKVLDTLPADVREEISWLLLLTPEEVRTSLMNQEFEDPSPSVL